jgi:hypothetical protein
VFFSFGFEGIEPDAERTRVMGRVLAWLQGKEPAWHHVYLPLILRGR